MDFEIFEGQDSYLISVNFIDNLFNIFWKEINYGLSHQ